MDDLTPNNITLIPIKDKVLTIDPESDPSFGLGAQLGGLGGTSAKTISDAINSAGNFVNDVINSRFDTDAKKILSDFTFGESGALKMITDENNGLWISPTGILAKKAGVNTIAITNAGDATFLGTLAALGGTFGAITGGTITLNTSGFIRGGQTEYNTGVGFWIGYDATGDPGYKLSIGNPDGDYLYWDGEHLVLNGSASLVGTLPWSDITDDGHKPQNDATVGADWDSNLLNIPDTLKTPSAAGLYLSGNYMGYYSGAVWNAYIDNSGNFYFKGDDNSSIDWNITTPATLTIKGKVVAGAGSLISTGYLSGIIAQGNLNIADRGWVQTSVFSVTDADTVAWGAGTFTSADGTAYSISAGNTGNMAAKTYIYLNTAVSTTVYQTTTTATTAVGAGKVLIAIAENGTTEATFKVLQGQGGENMDAANIVANSVTANELSTSITYTGAIIIDTAGLIRSGQTAFNTGVGWFIGNDAGTPKLSIGNPATYFLTWDGVNLATNFAKPVVKSYSFFITSSDTQFDITKPSGNTFRYTYDGNGTNPNISATTVPTGCVMNIQGGNFNAANKGSFIITGSGDNYFEITNAAGVAESNKTIGSGFLQITQYTWSKPSGLRYVMVEVVGGGGGGGGNSTNQYSSGGGGGGGYSRKYIAVATLGATETITIGAPGTVGAGTGGTGGTGGTSSFGSHCQATGGSGGTQNDAGGIGGVGSGGDLNANGGGGGAGATSSPRGTIGGNCYFGNGAGAITTAGDGLTCYSYGGGGGGAVSSGGNAAGGRGGAGVIYLTEFYI